MNGKPDLIFFPMLVVALVLISNRFRSVNFSLDKYSDFTAYVTTLFFVVPATVFSVYSMALSLKYQNAALIHKGAAATYIMPYEEPESAPSQSQEDIRSAAVQGLVNRLASGEPFLPADAYIVFADGVALLREVPGIEKLGVVITGWGFDFTASLGSRSVVSFPVWQTAESVQRTDFSDVDIVMEVQGYDAQIFFSAEMLEHVKTQYRACLESTFFVAHVRRDLEVPWCKS
jgi:hypothetical protein